MNIVWIQSGALIALVAMAGPVIVHLLRRHRAKRVPFPTLRFVVLAQAPAVRLTLPTDWRLMILRMLIVATAAAAWGQPLMITRQRQDRMQRTIARAIVIDTSLSTVPVSAQLREAAAAERQGGALTTDVASDDLRDAVRQAVGELGHLDAGRKEVVVISDFQVGAFSSGDVARVPSEIGLRLIAIGPPRVPPGSLSPFSLFAVDGVTRLTGTITVQGPATRLRIAAGGTSSAAPNISAAPGELPSVERLLRTVARAGAAAPPANRPVGMAFEGVAEPDVVPPKEPWMLDAILRMRDDDSLRRAAWAQPADSTRPQLGGGWVTVATDRFANAVVAVAARGRELTAYVASRPSDLIAALALRSLLFAAAEPFDWKEREPERLSRSQLKEWNRPSTEIPPVRWQYQAPGDARSMWVAVLALLAIEQVWRRSRATARASEQSAHAA